MAMWPHDASVTLFGGVMGGTGWADIEPTCAHGSRHGVSLICVGNQIPRCALNLGTPPTNNKGQPRMNRFVKTAAIAAIAAIGVIGTTGAASAAAPAEKATGSVTWDFNHGQVTGSVIFNANNKTGGTLDYQASNGMWLHGVVTPGSFQKMDGKTAVFGGEITSGSDDFTVNHDGTDYFTVKVVDGGTSGRNGDIIAVLANMDGHGNWLTSAKADTTRDYPMTPETAGIVTSGNLTVF
jgi:hypothetical protein